MGGTIAVTVREEDGTVYKMARWTNTLPHFVLNEKLYNKNPDHLSAYLQTKYDGMGGEFIIDTSPFIVQEFEVADQQDIQAMKKEIQRLGFVLTDEDIARWEQFREE